MVSTSAVSFSSSGKNPPWLVRSISCNAGMAVVTVTVWPAGVGDSRVALPPGLASWSADSATV